MTQRSVCLIGPGHVSSTPRLVKEADALVEAGYRVHVVAGRHFAPADPLDADILRTARWTCSRLDYRAGAALLRKLRRRVARRMVTRPIFANWQTAAHALHPETFRLAAIAGRQDADLYWGHCLPGLAAAGIAAQSRRKIHGFDAEDFHEAETHEAISDPVERTARAILLHRFLPGCASVTASSPLIAAQYAESYRIPVPTTVLNVFPLAHSPAAPQDPGVISEQRPARCYWFSQTIGSGRGLESIVAVLARMQAPVELHLRGNPVAGYAARLQAHAIAAGYGRRIHFLPLAGPPEMARLAAGFDLGLSIEEAQPLNHDLCLANKIFVYLLAGIPQLMSRTRGQARLAAELGAAALLAELDRPQETARELDAFFSSPARVAAGRHAAWKLARQRFCWDMEKTRFLAAIEHALP